MSEWFKEHAWKACVGVTPPWVRIPLSPLKRHAALTHRLWGAVQLEPENPARSGRKQRYRVNQCDTVSPGACTSVRRLLEILNLHSFFSVGPTGQDVVGAKRGSAQP